MRGGLETALDCDIDRETIGTHEVDSLIALAEGAGTMEARQAVARS